MAVSFPLEPAQPALLTPVGRLTTSRVCWAGCAFCRMAIPSPRMSLPDAPPGLNLDRAHADGIPWRKAAWLKLRGGLSLKEPFDYWLHTIRTIKQYSDAPLTVFSPVEIWHFHVQERRPVRELVRLLKWAGADFLGPGGSELWLTQLPPEWAPYRITQSEWLTVAEAAGAAELAFSAAILAVPNGLAALTADALAVLRDVTPHHLEVKPLVSDGTHLAGLGNANVLHAAALVQQLRHDLPEIPVYVDWPEDPTDTDTIFGSAGAERVLIPVWEVSP